MMTLQYIDISIETMIYLEMTQSVSKKGDFLCRKRQQVTNIPKKIPKKFWNISIHGKNGSQKLPEATPSHFRRIFIKA